MHIENGRDGGERMHTHHPKMLSGLSIANQERHQAFNFSLKRVKPVGGQGNEEEMTAINGGGTLI